MSERWFKETVIYCVDVETFQDSDGDGWGDLPGLTGRLDYLSRLGVTCLWLNPVHPTPNRDNGYDVADYFGIDPRLGSLGDFAEMTRQARARGIRVLMDLVVNHTSNEHPWFRSARADPRSPYRDWYIWSTTEPTDRRAGIVFPGEQNETWTWDETAQAWYYHRFYNFQPDLNWSNPAVRAEIKKVMAFWLQLGASGFRVDAAPFVLELTKPDSSAPPVRDFSILDDWRQEMQWHTGDSVLLLEANVDPADLADYCAGRPDGPNDRAHMLFAFSLNPYLWLALARQEAEPLVTALTTMPKLAPMAQWATFLRNHDELDLSRLTVDQRAEVFASFGPKPDMLLYGRGIRRRLAPMLKGDRAHIELAYALQFAMPGTPVLRYGEEIGMGENLSLPGRSAIRTPMQWSDSHTAGFSDADPANTVQPVLTRGAFGARKVNVRVQQADSDSLLSWMERLIRVLRECPEIGVGKPTVVDVPLPKSVLVHRFDAPEGSVLLMHNLAAHEVSLDLGEPAGVPDEPYEIFSDRRYPAPTRQLTDLPLAGFGYRWLRLARRLGG